MSVGDTAEHFPRGLHSVLTETLSVRYYYPDLSLHVLGPLTFIGLDGNGQQPRESKAAL